MTERKFAGTTIRSDCRVVASWRPVDPQCRAVADKVCSVYRKRRGNATPNSGPRSDPAVTGESRGAVTTARPPSLRPPLSRVAVARLVQLVGVFDAVTAILPGPHGRGAAVVEYLPTEGILSARAATGVLGLLLIYLGAGLRRGKRRAWRIAVGLAAAGALLHVVRGLDFDAAVISTALLVLLVAVRGQFQGVADPRSRWRALTALLGFGAAGFLLGFVEIAVRANRLVDHPGWRYWAEESALGLLGISGPVRFVHPVGAEAVSLTTGAFGLLAGGAALVLLLRPGARRPERTVADDEQLRELLGRYGGGDSLGYFALRTDKSLMWSPDRRAAVAYRVINGVSLGSGDPIGPEAAWPGAIAAWLDDCARHVWTPAVLGCSRAG